MDKQETFSLIWRFVWPTLIIAAAATLLAGATFLIWGQLSDLSIRSYSDRLFWAGIALIVVGGVAIVASIGSFRTLGTPSVFTAGADARNAQSRIQDHFNVNAKRYTFVLRFLASGVLCIAISALIEVLSRPR
jgi:hypothetical protein